MTKPDDIFKNEMQSSRDKRLRSLLKKGTEIKPTSTFALTCAECVENLDKANWSKK